MDNADAVAERIDALLPQTQCGRCGFRACRPYAEAIATGEADIDRCPPGGDEGVARLARLLGRAAKPLDPECGEHRPPQVALIDEAACIGCTKCLPPCPVDAIIGGRKQMHTIIAALCTGCELCVEPCPVDCISMVPRNSLTAAAAAPDPQTNRQRFMAHNERITRHARERDAMLASRKQMAMPAAANAAPALPRET